jgi:dsRNA-specific ribonuclease
MKEQIKKLFAQLNKDEQIELLKELSNNTETSMSIAEFAQFVQKQFGKNVEFTVSQTGLDHCPTITAIAHTPWGDFEGLGSNQKIAKSNACDKAYEAMNA